MTRLILAIAFTLVYNLSVGQDCKVEKDPFSNAQVVTYEFGKYTVFELKENKILLTYYFRFEGELNTTMPKGSLVSFKFESGDMVELPAIQDVNPVTQVASSGKITTIWTEYFVVMEVSAEQIELFATSMMTHVKYPDMKGGFLTQDRSKRWVKHFNEGAQCIQSNMSK